MILSVRSTNLGTIFQFNIGNFAYVWFFLLVIQFKQSDCVNIDLEAFEAFIGIMICENIILAGIFFIHPMLYSKICI